MRRPAVTAACVCALAWLLPGTAAHAQEPVAPATPIVCYPVPPLDECRRTYYQALTDWRAVQRELNRGDSFMGGHRRHDMEYWHAETTYVKDVWWEAWTIRDTPMDGVRDAAALSLIGLVGYDDYAHGRLPPPLSWR